MRSRARFFSLGALAGVLAACGGHGSTSFHDLESGLSFHYPRNWSVTGFSHTNSPRRLIAASFHVGPDDVEGDCGGMQALQSLPQGDVAVLLIAYGSTSVFPAHPGNFTLREFKRADYECFGSSYMLRFSRSGHDVQAHVALGRRASAERRRQALSILNSLEG